MYSFESKVMAVAVFFLLSSFMASTSAIAGDGGPAGPFYQLQWQGRGVSAEIQINGVPFERSEFKSGGTGSAPLNLWLKPGVNNVVVKLNSLKGQAEDGRSFSVLLEKDEPGQFTGDGEKVFDFSWTEGKDKMPAEKKFEFTPQAAPLIQLWAKSEQINLDANAQKEIRAYLGVISDAYMKADVNKLAELLEFKTTEYGTALAGRTPGMDEIKEMLKGSFNSMKSNKMKFRPIDTAGAKLELVGDKRIVIVTDKNGQAPLVAVSPKGESSQELQIYLTRVNGKWVWAR